MCVYKSLYKNTVVFFPWRLFSFCESINWFTGDFRKIGSPRFSHMYPLYIWLSLSWTQTNLTINHSANTNGNPLTITDKIPSLRDTSWSVRYDSSLFTLRLRLVIRIIRWLNISFSHTHTYAHVHTRACIYTDTDVYVSYESFLGVLWYRSPRLLTSSPDTPPVSEEKLAYWKTRKT